MLEKEELQKNTSRRKPQGPVCLRHEVEDHVKFSCVEWWLKRALQEDEDLCKQTQDSYFLYDLGSFEQAASSFWTMILPPNVKFSSWNFPTLDQVKNLALCFQNSLSLYSSQLLND
jgi:hypothetical protein